MGRQAGERHTADAAISPTVSAACVCPDIRNPTDLAPQPSTTPSIRTPRMPRHTQPDRTADDTSRTHTVRINPRVATYTTQQIDQPKPIRPATGSSRACPDIRNPTNLTPRPSTTQSIRTPRMPRRTQPDKPGQSQIFSARQYLRHACHDIHNPTNRQEIRADTTSPAGLRMFGHTQPD